MGMKATLRTLKNYGSFPEFLPVNGAGFKRSFPGVCIGQWTKNGIISSFIQYLRGGLLPLYVREHLH